MLFPRVNFTTCSDQLNLLNFSESDAETLSCTEDFELDRSKLDVPYAVVEILVAFFAVIGNVFVIIAFLSDKKLRKRTNYYIISLAFADFLMGLIGIPFAILVSIKTIYVHKREKTS